MTFQTGGLVPRPTGDDSFGAGVTSSPRKHYSAIAGLSPKNWRAQWPAFREACKMSIGADCAYTSNGIEREVDVIEVLDDAVIMRDKETGRGIMLDISGPEPKDCDIVVAQPAEMPLSLYDELMEGVRRFEADHQGL